MSRTRNSLGSIFLSRPPGPVAQVCRRKPLGGMLLRRISKRGRERLVWLQRTSK
jgi:hypothetical protein